MAQTDLSRIITNFSAQLSTIVEQIASERIRAALNGAFAPVKRGPGRPRKNGLGPLPLPAPKKPRKKQLCPVPGCRNPAAPVFGMVCGKHRDVPKRKIKEYREARRAAAPRKR